MSNIAFFGLGTMGLPMAINLLKAGHKIFAMAREGEIGHIEAAKYGASIVSSLEEMLKTADFIISVVPNDAAVKDVLINPKMKQLVKPGSIIIEMTSCMPETVIEVAEYYKDVNVSVIDAPLTGALPKAIDGTLIILGAGSDDDFTRAASIFAAISEKVFQLGKVGNGKLIKAMTNLLGAINLTAVGEFYRFAKSRGLDMAQLEEVVQFSAGGSTQFNRNFRKIVDGKFDSTFSLSLMRKDIGIALQCASKDPDLFTPLGQTTFDLFKQASSYDKEDCIAIVKVDKEPKKD